MFIVPKPPINEPPSLLEGRTLRVDEAAASSKRLSQTSNRDFVWSESYVLAGALWKRLVKNVGESEAKGIMRHLMGDKKPGRPGTDEKDALKVFIYVHLLHWGLGQTDGKIASRIHKSNPYFVQFESGAVAVANSEFTEAHMCPAEDDPIVGRKPIDMGLAAIKKRVERVRRTAIDDDLLSKDYKPRSYHRD